MRIEPFVAGFRSTIPPLAALALAACFGSPTSPPPGVSSLTLVSGGGQTGTPGYRLEQQVVVEVRDDAGMPARGVEVNFTADDPTSYQEPRVDTTDAEGQARTWWRLGGALGTQRLTAAIDTVGVTPVHIDASVASAQVLAAAGGMESGLCTITSAGALSCAPLPHTNQPNPQGSATTILAGTRFTDVVIPGWHLNPRGCAATESGRIWCFTLSGQAQVSDVTELSGAYPALVRLAVATDQVLNPSYCGLTVDGEAWCWGANGSGQLGVGDTEDHATPVALASGEHFIWLRLSSGGGCAVTTEGSARCWGRNRYGEGGPPAGENHIAPRAIATALAFRQVTRYDFESGACGISTQNQLYCWGGVTGILGASQTSPLGEAPVLVPTSTPLAALTENHLRIFVLQQNGGGAWTGDWSGFADGLFGQFHPFKLSGVIRDLMTQTGDHVDCGHARTTESVLCQSTYSMLYPTAYGSQQEEMPFFVEPGKYVLPPVIGIPNP